LICLPAIALAFLIPACSSTPHGPPLVPVEGTITLDGKPLSGANVIFIPQGQTLGQSAVGRTDAAGRFELNTPDLEHQGAASGNYRVVISKKVNPDGSDFNPAPDQDPMLAAYKELLPPTYTDEALTTLQAEVPPEGAKTLDFKLTSKGR
jgi:hypothetical protein